VHAGIDLSCTLGVKYCQLPQSQGVADNMLPLDLQTPRDIARTLARRVKALRLERGWTQQETAERAGLALATYRRFERTGRISLERLLKLAVILDARGGFEHLFAPGPARTLAELEQRVERPSRKRGKRSDAQT
jgi:DNA-binding XRE family transcriptional regulator